MVTPYTEIKALNWSSLKHMATSARLYKWRMEHPRPETPALTLGTAIHCAILEPDAFERRYVVRPDGLDLRTKAGKAWKDETGDRLILSAGQGETVIRCAAAVMEHGPARAILETEGVETEVPLQWEINGIACKGRLDLLAPALLSDLKTYGKDFTFLEAEAARMLYHGQLAWYRDGAVACDRLDPDAPVKMIVVETHEPYDVAVRTYPTWVIEIGRKIYQSCLSELQVAEHTGEYPGRFPAELDMDIPRWADPDRGSYDDEEVFSV